MARIAPPLAPGFLVQAVIWALRRYAASRQMGGASPIPMDRDPGDKQGMPWVELCSLLEQAAERSGDAALGLSLGQEITEGNLHIFGPTLVASRTLRDALAHAEALQQAMFAEVYWRLEIGPHEARYLCRHEVIGPVLEDTLGAMVSRMICRFLGGGLEGSIAIRLTREPPRELEPYTRFWGESVHFRANATGVSFPSSALDRPRAGTDATLAAVLRNQTVELIHRAAQPPSQTWSQRVEAELRRYEPRAQVGLEQLGARMGTSARSLRYRLAQEGAQLSELVARVRCEHALRHLQMGLSVRQVADLLGYADASAFHRAFKRWTGESPSRYFSRGKGA